MPDDAGEGMERDEREKENKAKEEAAAAGENNTANGGGGGAPSQHQHSSTASPRLVSPPEHLIVNGLGGAFLHPTHTFAGSVFGVPSMAGGGARHGAATAAACARSYHSRLFWWPRCPVRLVMGS